LLRLAVRQLFAFVERVDDENDATVSEGIVERRSSVDCFRPNVHVVWLNGITTTLPAKDASAK
jgi:hypothetical protein